MDDGAEAAPRCAACGTPLPVVPAEGNDNDWAAADGDDWDDVDDEVQPVDDDDDADLQPLGDDDELPPIDVEAQAVSDDDETLASLMGDEYDKVLESLDSTDSHRLSNEQMHAQMLDVSSSEVVIPPLESPPEALRDARSEVRSVPLGAETTVADAPVLDRSFPLRVLLWNIADLGGGPSGTPAVRKQWTIDALAHVIRAANPDLVTILELKKKGGQRLVEPKPPVPPPPNRVRGDSLTALWERFPVPKRYRKKAAASAVRNVAPQDAEDAAVREWQSEFANDLAKIFATRVRRAIWPGVTAESAPDPDWSETTQELDAERLDELNESIETAWEACEPLLIDRFGGPDDDDDDDAPAARLVATEIDVKRKTPKLIAEFHPYCVRLLVEEEYYDWLQPFAPRYSPTEREDAELGAERTARDKLAKFAVEQLLAYCGELFKGFIFSIAKEEVPRSRKQGREFEFEQILSRSNTEHLNRLYQSKLAAYARRKNETEDGPSTHAGLREFLRIRDALNAQCRARHVEVYESWPREVPEGAVKGLYTQDEAYGVLWRASKVSIDQEAVSYVSTYLARGEKEAGSLFSKREPLRIPVRLAKVKAAPEIGVIAWHPPSPKADNGPARGKDFSAFLEYCKAERQAKALGIVLSDLNIDTARPKKGLAPDGTPYIADCKPKLSFHRFFDTLLGPGANASHLYALADERSTLAVSDFTAWASDADHDFGSGSKQSLRALLNTAVKALPFNPSTTERGEPVSLLNSVEDVLGLIESFATSPQQRYGASGYDKILVYSPRTDGWRLEQASVFVIPFPMVLATDKERKLFRIHGELLLEHLRPFWQLIQREDARLEEEERIFGHLRGAGVTLKGSDDARWVDLMADAKKMSDHMPLVSDLRLVYDGREKLVVEETALPPEVPEALRGSEEMRRLEALCLAYQKSTESDEVAARALDQILEAAAQVGEAEHERSGSLVADAMQVRLTLVALRAEGFDTAAYWGRRPTLESDGGRRSAVRAISMDEHLTSLHQRREPNAGGGDCLFRSLAQLLFGDERHHGTVRQLAVNHLDDLLAGRGGGGGARVGPVSVETFRRDMGLLLDWHRAGWPNELAYRRVNGVDAWSQYLRAMSRDGVWGDHVVLAAVSNLFRVRFQTFARTSARAYWSDEVDFVPREEGHEAAPLLRLANLRNAHYEAVCPEEGLGPAVAGSPERYAALAVRRRRGGEGALRALAQSAATSSSSTASSAGGSSTDPAMTGPVCLWPSTNHFKHDTPTRHPRGLFLFGENDASKKNKHFQSSTQAIIRMNPNALGVRTCWVPGVGMVDTDFARNQQAIDDDCAEALRLLTQGLYTTLVVPWNLASNTLDIGTGVANLPKGAPRTWAHLQKKVQELIDWANAQLGKVRVVPRLTLLVPSVVTRNQEDLYVQEVSEAMQRAPSVLEDSSTSVVGVPNVVPLRTLRISGGTSPAMGRWSDATYAQNTAILDEDLRALIDRVESRQFRRLVLPRNSDGEILLGTELGQLDVYAPKTLAYLRGRLEGLCQRCKEVQVASSSNSLSSSTTAQEGVARGRARTKRRRDVNHDEAPVEDGTAPVEDDAAPVEDDAAPVEDDAAPVEDDASQDEQERESAPVARRPHKFPRMGPKRPEQ
ncbi:hypothetical protein HUA78_07440 [Myxococcus sp. CA033]|uniref:OTU domain-containing protein n=1 Tax=Myxococcus sp. CA033 TaxID=2741516 RepID=UPI00157B560B|nr:hypothetical protein [Myxococcus sp. CA033]NTX34266.1 hypothetical protein [Myxococcus sp. CA033]